MAMRGRSNRLGTFYCYKEESPSIDVGLSEGRRRGECVGRVRLTRHVHLGYDGKR